MAEPLFDTKPYEDAPQEPTNVQQRVTAYVTELLLDDIASLQNSVGQRSARRQALGLPMSESFAIQQAAINSLIVLVEQINGVTLPTQEPPIPQGEVPRG